MGGRRRRGGRKRKSAGRSKRARPNRGVLERGKGEKNTGRGGDRFLLFGRARWLSMSYARVKRRVSLDLEVSQLGRGNSSIFQGWVVGVGPRRSDCMHRGVASG